MTKEEHDDLLAKTLRTPEGKNALRKSIQLAAAKAADQLHEGEIGWYLARKLAKLPVPSKWRRPC